MSRAIPSLGVIVNAFGAKMLTITRACIIIEAKIEVKSGRCQRKRPLINVRGAGNAKRLSIFLIAKGFRDNILHFYKPNCQTGKERGESYRLVEGDFGCIR